MTHVQDMTLTVIFQGHLESGIDREYITYLYACLQWNDSYHTKGCFRWLQCRLSPLEADMCVFHCSLCYMMYLCFLLPWRSWHSRPVTENTLSCNKAWPLQ